MTVVRGCHNANDANMSSLFANVNVHAEWGQGLEVKQAVYRVIFFTTVGETFEQ